MKRFYSINSMHFAVAAMIFASTNIFAAQSSDENQALTQALQNQQNQPQVEVVNDPITVPSQAQTNSQTTTTTVQQPVILQNHPTNTLQQPAIIIQKQPTTVVEDSPLSESAADRLRKERLETEQQTESKIVEKLEQERIDAEKARADKVLNALDNKNKKDQDKKDDKATDAAVAATPAAAAAVAPATPEAAAAPQGQVISQSQAGINGNAQQTALQNGPAAGQAAVQAQSGVNGNAQQTAIQNPNADAAPQTVVVQQADQIKNIKTDDQAVPAQEIKTDVAPVAQAPEKSNKMFMGANLGFISYPTLDNVKTSGGAGLSVGTTIDNSYSIEGNFLYSRSQIEDVFAPGAIDFSGIYYPQYENMDQYMVGGTFKYNFLADSKFSPHVGASLDYIYRSYNVTQSFSYYTPLKGSSWAIDTGLLAGADFKVSDHFSIGADLSYMFNVSYQVSTNGTLQPSQIMYSQDSVGSPIEKVNFYSFLINLKYIF